MSTTLTYRRWKSIVRRTRCNTGVTATNYKNRGIRLCSRWQTYSNFLKDMGECPSDSYTVERKNNDKGYSPGNCCWATYKEQANNRRTSLRVRYKGKMRLFTELAEEHGIAYWTAYSRYTVLDWSLEDVFTRPVKGNGSRNPKLFFTFDGETKSADEWAAIAGVHQNTFSRRVKRGWTKEQCIYGKKGKRCVLPKENA